MQVVIANVSVIDVVFLGWTSVVSNKTLGLILSLVSITFRKL